MTLLKSDLLKQEELWILLFILGIVMLNWPFLSMVGKSTVFGYPLILIYLLIIWLVVILLAYLFDKEAAD